MMFARGREVVGAIALLLLLMLHIELSEISGMYYRGLRYDWESSTRRQTTISAAIATPQAEFRYPVDLLNGMNYSRQLPVPLRVLQDYMQMHSDDALQRDPHPERRRFSLAYYSCPQEAGNRLHRFWNDLLWAILTNRTLLWKYRGHGKCQTYANNCTVTNMEENCAEILVRAPWMASYEAWRGRLFDVPSNSSRESFPDYTVPFRIPYHATMGRARDRPEWPVPENYEQHYGVDVPAKYPQRLVAFPNCYSKFHKLGNSTLQETVLRTAAGRTKAKQLFSLGADFLYGMLHRFTFDFAASIRNSVPHSLEEQSSDYFTIGLHSRHRYAAHDGCNIDRELECVQKILNRRTDARPVRVGIMADRICTVQNLTDALEAKNLSVVSFRHEKTTLGKHEEHGPYAGIGFYEDLAVVSTARSAIIGMARSSTDVLRELITFNQVMDHWNSGGPLVSTVHNCVLPPLLSLGASATTQALTK